jgi:hypothetical protein
MLSNQVTLLDDTNSISKPKEKPMEYADIVVVRERRGVDIFICRISIRCPRQHPALSFALTHICTHFIFRKDKNAVIYFFNRRECL